MKSRGASFNGADGVVRPAETLALRPTDHPVCATKVASRHWFDRASTPPLRGGECCSFPIHSQLHKPRLQYSRAHASAPIIAPMLSACPELSASRISAMSFVIPEHGILRSRTT